MNSRHPSDVAAMVELMLIGGGRTLTAQEIASRLPYPVPVDEVVAQINDDYRARGIQIVRVAGGGYAARTRPEFSDLCRTHITRPYRLSPAGMQTLAVIAYFQPVTRAEIERIRGVSLSKGTLDLLILTGWVRPGPRRQSPGSPMTFVTTQAFLDHFNLDGVEALPDMERLRSEGLLDASLGLSLPGGEVPLEAAE